MIVSSDRLAGQVLWNLEMRHDLYEYIENRQIQGEERRGKAGSEYFDGKILIYLLIMRVRGHQGVVWINF